MASPEIQRLQDKISRMEILISEGDKARATLSRKVDNIQLTGGTIGDPTTPSAPVSNLLWNGELGHSVNSWYDAAYVLTDVAKECAHFFSHDAPVALDTLSATDARTSSANKTLKAPSHSTYSLIYGDWDSVNGQGRLNGTKSIDTPLPNNFVDATLGNVFASFVLAKRNAFIDIPSTARLGVGIWDNTAGQRDWLRGSVGFDAVASIDGGSTVSRTYRMYVETDRGYSILSNAVTVNAPDDGQYDSDNFVSLSWHAVTGYRNIQLIVYTPSTGVYRLIEELSSGASTFIDNGGFLRTMTGYPTATETERKAVAYTATGEISEIATDGSRWSTFASAIQIPDNYDRGLTTDRQWFRIFLTELCDLLVDGCTTDGTANVACGGSAFDAAYDTLFDAGTLVAKVYDADGVLIATTTLASRTDAANIVLGTTIPAGTGRIVRIVGGGFHPILLDKIHLGFQRNVSFAPNPLDARTLQPVAAPSGSTQGGPGSPPHGTNTVTCVVPETPVLIPFGSFGETATIEADDLDRGWNVEGEHNEPNVVGDLQSGFARTRLVKTQNGFWFDITNGHRFRSTRFDRGGTPLVELAVGSPVVTKENGRDVLSAISYIGPLGPKRRVVTPRLIGGVYYVAGRWEPTAWERFKIWIGWMKPKQGGIYSHNRSIDTPEEIP